MFFLGCSRERDLDCNPLERVSATGYQPPRQRKRWHVPAGIWNRAYLTLPARSPSGRHLSRVRNRGWRLTFEKPRSECSHDGCEGDNFALHLCEMHYERWRRKIGLGPANDPNANELGERRCNTCLRWFPPWGLAVRTQCKGCHNAQRAMRYAVIKGQLRSALLDSQGGRCAICGRDISGRFENGRHIAHIDHDHSCCPGPLATACGECIRGALCPNCNYGLGNFQDSIDNLLAAIEYLRKRHEQKEALAA